MPEMEIGAAIASDNPEVPELKIIPLPMTMQAHPDMARLTLVFPRLDETMVRLGDSIHQSPPLGPIGFNSGLPSKGRRLSSSAW